MHVTRTALAAVLALAGSITAASAQPYGPPPPPPGPVYAAPPPPPGVVYARPPHGWVGPHYYWNGRHWHHRRWFHDHWRYY